MIKQPFVIRIEPRYAETDQMGIIYHANYINWFEVARTKLMQHIGFPYDKLEASGLLFPILRVEVRYKKPAVYGRAVNIDLFLERYTSVRICYRYEVRDEETQELLVEGFTDLGATDKNLHVVNLAKVHPSFDQAIKQYKASREEGE